MGGSKHIVLVHGACLGGWSWFKVATRLRAAGYRVDAPDLAASGADPRPLREVPTFRDYTAPLLDLPGPALRRVEQCTRPGPRNLRAPLQVHVY